MLWSLIVTFLCLIGFTWQVYTISLQYFEYDTTSQVILFKNDPIRPPVIDVCFDNSDIVVNSNNASARMLFAAATPSQAIVQPLFRHDDFSYSVVPGNISELIVSRGIRQAKFCYSIELNSNITFPRRFIVNSIKSPYFY